MEFSMSRSPRLKYFALASTILMPLGVSALAQPATAPNQAIDSPVERGFVQPAAQHRAYDVIKEKARIANGKLVQNRDDEITQPDISPFRSRIPPNLQRNETCLR
jgi:hypothetical protein